MTGLPDNNSGNDFIRGLETRACVNGMTKSDVERLKNALVKKIVNDDTIVEMTDDGKIIVADSDGLYLSFDGNILGLIKDSSGDYVPQTVPYLPEDEDENPLAPPNDTIMTSANIGVDPRIVHTTGNESISGNKTFNNICYLKSAPDIKTSQTWCEIQMGSKGFSNVIESRKYNSDYTLYDEHFRVGYHHTTETATWVKLAGYAPRTNLGDTSENQASIRLVINTKNDNTGSLTLVFTKTDGTEVTKNLGSFNGTSWT